MLEQGLNAECAIYSYGGTPNQIVIGHRGLIRYYVNVKGEAAHSGSSSWQQGTKGASAIESLIKVLNSIDTLRMPGENKYFEGYGFMQTVTKISGGIGESIVPPNAEALVDVRLLPGQDPEVYLSNLRKLCDSLKSTKTQITVIVKNNIPGVVIDENSKIVQILTTLIEAKGDKVIIKGAGPANEGYMLIQKGIPTICGYGVSGDGFHMVNENMEVNSIVPTLETYVKAALMLH